MVTRESAEWWTVIRVDGMLPVEWIVRCLSEWIVCQYEIYLDPHDVWTPCFMIFRPFVGLPVLCIPNISPRINCDFAERVCERHNLVRVITKILGTRHRAFRQPRFEQNLNGFWHCASRLIWGKCPRGATW